MPLKMLTWLRGIRDRKMDAAKFAQLLEIAKARKIASNGEEVIESASAESLETNLKNNPTMTVDISSLGMDEEKTTEEDIIEVVGDIIYSTDDLHIPKILGVARDDITLNTKQQEFLDKVITGEDVVLIGAAGTGKTTSMRQTTRELIESERLPRLTRGTKHLHAGKHGGAILSYTRKAVNNIRHAVVEELKDHTLTIHKLLEFAPVYYEIQDPDNPGMFKKTMRFEPQRGEYNPLPEDLVFLAFEESSMVSVELYQLLQKAMPHPHQEVFLGDIQQLPPIFGLAILGFKLVELSVVELTEVYRQALNSPIISLAWKLLEGNPHDFSPVVEKYTTTSGGKKVERVRAPKLEEYTRTDPESGSAVKFQIWQKSLSPDLGLMTTTKQFEAWIESGYYNPEEDIILLPFNKAFGTDELNKGIMQYLGRKRNAVVHEVISGFNKLYLAEGDRVLFDKEDAIIERIVTNGNYLGKRPQPASIHLDRWGHLQSELTEQEKLSARVDNEVMDLEAIEKFIDLASNVEDRVRAASHIITVRYTYNNDEEQEVILEDAAEVNALLGGYAITVHKSQGSEWEKVFFVMHNSHAVMNQRELLYTAVTRAKKFLHIVAERDTFYKGVKSQRIKGDTIQEKAQFFMGKKEELDRIKAEKGELDLHHVSLKDKKVLEGPKDKVVEIGGKKAIKLENVASEKIKLEAEIALDSWWAVARSKFNKGNFELGPRPELSFNIASRRVVGRAYLRMNKIALNPVWLAVAEEDDEVFDIITNDTIPHEIAHLIAWKKHKDGGHGTFWKLIMMQMGLKDKAKATVAGLPPCMESKDELLKKILIEAGSSVEETNENETLEDGEVE